MPDTCKKQGCPHANESAEIAVKKVFALLGVNVDEPKEVEEFRMDLRFGRSLRRVADRGVLAVVGLGAVAIAGATWAGIVNSMRGH